MLECARDNPFRPVNWRWLRAGGVVDGSQPRPTRRRDGPDGYKWIKQAAEFLRTLNAIRSDAAMRELAWRRPAIYWAHFAHQSESSMKWRIEALLLARASDQEIGFACGVPAEVIAAYAALWFDVREKLNHPGYVLHNAIGPGVQMGLSERDFDVLWKLYGYFYGPHAVEALACGFVNPTWCATPDRLGSVLQDDAISTMKLKAAIAAKTIQVNYNNQLDLLGHFVKFVEIERTTDSAGRAQTQILDNIAALMTALPFHVDGREPRSGRDAPAGKVQSFSRTAIELSYEETLTVAAGRPLPQEEEARQLMFPPAPAALAAGGPDESTEQGG